MQQPVVKSERHEPVFSTPSYYQQQQQLQQQQNAQLQQQQRQTTNGNSSAATPGKADIKSAATPINKNEESLPDFPSIKGVFGWTMIENVHVPFILRYDKPFVSVRIVEMKLLTKYPNSYPDELGKHAPLTSFYITSNEVKLLNEINVRHCECEYGRKPFTSNDLIVQLPDFIKFYELVKKTFPEVSSGKGSGVTGWLQIKNTVTPFIRRGDQAKYVPLSVIQYAAGLLTNMKVTGVPPTLAECKLLNDACSKAGVEFTFSESTTRLINLDNVLKVVNVEVTELPSNNPLKHATYMELPTSTSVSQTHVKAPTSNGALPPDTNASKVQSKPPNNIRQYHDQLPPLQVQNNKRPAIPNNLGFDPRLMADSRFVELLRMQLMLQPDTNGMFGAQNGNSNASNLPIPAASAMTPLMQYYENLQRVTNQNLETQRQLGQTLGQGGCDESRSPGCSQSPRSRPPSQTRPPSGPSLSRPPSVSPLSPSAGPSQQPSPHSQHITSYPALFDAASRMPFMNNPASLQQSNMLYDNLMNSNINRLNETSVPHHQRPKTNMTSAQISSSSHTTKPPPPPLVLMGETGGSTSNTDMNSGNNSVLQSPNHAVAGPSAQEIVEQPRPQTYVSADSSGNVFIKGAWLNNKSVSCLNVDDAKRKGQYCLVEAVCKLYFNGCSVQEFLFALENVLNIPLVVCNKKEEKAFIGYYNLPVTELKCNKMILFEDLEKYFPQLTYMFPSKETLTQSDTSYDTSLDNMNNVDNTIRSGHQKRVHSDRTMFADRSHAKLPRNSTGGADDDDAVIILD